LEGAALLIGALNVMSLAVQYSSTRYVYDLIPELAVKSIDQREEIDEVDDEDCNGISSPTLFTAQKYDQEKNLRVTDAQMCKLCDLPTGLKIYLQQPVALGGFALALLYLNVMTFGAVMTAYLVWKGMTLSHIGIWRGISAGIGLLGTCSYHVSTRHSSLAFTGLWSVAFQFASLTVSYASLFVSHDVTSLVMLVGGVCLSRIGLYVFDLTITQYMQSSVPTRYRGIVGGVQNSIQAMFLFLSFFLGLIFPDPRDFSLLVATGYVSVGLAMVCYIAAVYTNRKTFLSTS